MRTIYLIRHGKPEFPDERKYCIGQTDLPLSEEGRAQIQALGEKFAGHRIETIYSSPLKRCWESALILRDALDKSIPIEVVDDLAEINMGDWDGLSFDEIREQFPEEYAARGADMYRFRPPRGESFADCAKRAEKTWDKLRAESRGDILIIGHAGWFRTLICGWEKRKPAELLQIPFGYGQIYEKKDLVFDALISAAGRSSRMGDFKPLMKLGDQTVLEREIQTLRACGVHEITIITGRQAEDIRAAVSGPGIHFIHNPAYAQTKMFDSVCLGLSYYEEKRKTAGKEALDGIFFFPVDVPLFTPFTLEYEKYRFAQGEGDVYLPEYEKTPGHPLLIRADVIEKLLQHDGTMGLKGACEQPGIRRVSLDVPDRGCAFDADTQEEFQRLRDWESERPVPDKEQCERLLAWFHTPETTVRHSRAVAALAAELTDKILRHESEMRVEAEHLPDQEVYTDPGSLSEPDKAQAQKRIRNVYQSLKLDKHKIYAAALLHDIAKAYPEHPETGARWLRLLGHTGIADIVADHMDLPEEKLGYLNERLIVYLADKQVQGERRVTIEERFAAKREKFKDDPEALAGVERRYQLAKRAEMYFNYVTEVNL